MADGAVYKTLMSVDTRGSGGYLDGAKKRMRARIYDLAHASFEAAGVARSMLHLEDRGDGFIAAVDARIPPVRLLGTWLAEVHQRQRAGNEDLARPLGLRVGLHVGPVTHDEEGLSGHAMDLVSPARGLGGDPDGAGPLGARSGPGGLRVAAPRDRPARRTVRGAVRVPPGPGRAEGGPGDRVVPRAGRGPARGAG